MKAKVNKLLLDALRAGIRHQVEERQAKAALRAIDAFLIYRPSDPNGP